MPPPHAILPRLVLFDVDGTLVLTGGAGARSMSLALRDLVGIDDAFEGIPMPGRTDQIILRDALVRGGHGADESLPRRFHDRYLEHLAREIHTPAPGKFKGVLPGVRELLETLAPREDVVVALLTGNFREAARLKLEHFDLWKYFRCGAFGEDAHDRNDLVPIAVTRSHACGVPELPREHVVVIGDTPLDVACARAAGARAIAVATGGTQTETLRGSGADAVFEDLSDTTAVLAAIMR
ncbi:MAG TPA: HAD hydrolase-like protein [Vicinamibacterales bacterium]|nr:HAD hydrolase-like protein [Vicinamibacterales bacterium]